MIFFLQTACLGLAAFLLGTAVATPLQADRTGTHVAQHHEVLESSGGLPEALFKPVEARAADAYASGILYRRLHHPTPEPATHPIAAESHDHAARAQTQAGNAWGTRAKSYRAGSDIRVLAEGLAEQHHLTATFHTETAAEHRDPDCLLNPEDSHMQAQQSIKDALKSELKAQGNHH